MKPFQTALSLLLSTAVLTTSTAAFADNAVATGCDSTKVDVQVTSPQPVIVYQAKNTEPFRMDPSKQLCTSPCRATVDLQKGDRIIVQTIGGVPDMAFVRLDPEHKSTVLKVKPSNTASRVAALSLSVAGTLTLIGGIAVGLDALGRHPFADDPVAKNRQQTEGNVALGLLGGGATLSLTSLILGLATQTSVDVRPRKVSLSPWVMPTMGTDGKANGAVVGISGKF